jgi:hypothetical protein
MVTHTRDNVDDKSTHGRKGLETVTQTYYSPKSIATGIDNKTVSISAHQNVFYLSRITLSIAPVIHTDPNDRMIS